MDNIVIILIGEKDIKQKWLDLHPEINNEQYECVNNFNITNIEPYLKNKKNVLINEDNQNNLILTELKTLIENLTQYLKNIEEQVIIYECYSAIKSIDNSEYIITNTLSVDDLYL